MLPFNEGSELGIPGGRAKSGKVYGNVENAGLVATSYEELSGTEWYCFKAAKGALSDEVKGRARIFDREPTLGELTNPSMTIACARPA